MISKTKNSVEISDKIFPFFLESQFFRSAGNAIEQIKSGLIVTKIARLVVPSTTGFSSLQQGTHPVDQNFGNTLRCDARCNV